jgi:hypothetical protein
VNNLPILRERLLANPLFKPTFDKQFQNNRDLPAWFVEYISTRYGAESPGKEITIEGRVYEVYSVCQPHNCYGNSINIVFVSGGMKAWALLASDNGQRYRLFGQSLPPDREETTVFDYLRRGTQTTWDRVNNSSS